MIGVDVLLVVSFFVILLSGLLLRSALLIRCGWIGKDTFYHLLIAREMRQNGHLPDMVDRFSEPERYDYPPLMHVLLAQIPKEWDKAAQYLSPLVDTVVAGGIFLFCLNVATYEVALVAMAVYCFTPFAIDISFYLSPRSFANAFLVLCLIATYYTLGTFSLLPFVISVVSASLVLLTHRLTAQSLSAVLVTEAVVFLDFTPIVILLASVILAILLTRGFYLRVLRGHIDFIRVLGARLLDPEARKGHSNLISNIKVILFNLPIITILPILLIWTLPSSPLLIFALAWVLGLIIISCMWVIGEGHRHMANSVAALAIIVGSWAMGSNMIWIVILLLALSLTLSSFKIWRLSIQPEDSGVMSLEVLQACNAVRRMGSPQDVILCLPTQLSYNVAYFSGAIIAQSSGGFAKGLAYNCRINSMIQDRQINELIANLGVKWVLTIDKKIPMPLAEEFHFGPNVTLYHVI